LAANVRLAGQLRFALVYPPFDDRRDRSAYYVAPPLGLLYLGAYLERAGCDVRIHDFIFDLKIGAINSDLNLYTQCADLIVSGKPDVVAFSTQCSTSPGALSIARIVKQRLPATLVLLGGHDVSFLANSYLRAFPFVDFVLAGEAELTISKLALAISSRTPLESIPGLGFREEFGRIRITSGEDRVSDLDTLLAPSYHLVSPLSEYFNLSRRPTILVDSGRGCAFACEFCQTTLLNGRKVRYRSVESLVAELKLYQRQYGEFEAYFVHDLFSARRKFVVELCERLIDEDLRMSWQCRCRVDQIDHSLLELMVRAGCRMVLYGIESGSEQTLDLMNKNLSLGSTAETLQRVASTVAAGIFPSLSMVIGLPKETLTALDETMALAAEFVKLGRVNAFIQLMSPLPGTSLAKRLEPRFTYEGLNAPTAFSQGIEFVDGKRLPEDEALINSWPKIFQSFQVVVPDHGQLNLCIDISLAYCKLLEVYCHTFTGLTRTLGLRHLDLFQDFRKFLCGKRKRSNLVGVRDFELWDSFKSYAEDHVKMVHQEELLETFTYERLVHEVSISSPVVPTTTTESGAFRLHSSARLFKSRAATGPWDAWAKRECADRESVFLIYQGPDRLFSIRLDDITVEALELLADLNASDASDREYSALRCILAHLCRFGLLVPLSPDFKQSIESTSVHVEGN
jgi:radical SAM superfamily enzyme YgiQ (UPF0313 family)